MVSGPGTTRAALRRLRPDLVARFDAELPGARAAVLTRLWGALLREPLPGVVRCAGGVRVAGVTVAGAAVAPFAGAVRSVDVDGGGCDDPASLVRRLGWVERFAVELDDSVANLALARADRRPVRLADLGGGAGLARAEQAVVDGHPLHPCCRTRTGMDTADVLAYAPEHAPLVRPVRLRVPADRWAGDGPAELAAHPWQAERLLGVYPFLEPVGHLGDHRPLMSLRTLAPVDGGPHLKTAVGVQMTSAVRTVSPAALHNGPLLSALVAEVAADLPVEVLAETGGGAVLVDGVPDRQLAFLRRDAPRLRPGEVVVPLATLGADPGLRADLPGIGPALVRLLVPTLMTVLGRGVALEAHGQNTLVVLRGTRPVRIVYRDFGGVRVHPGRLGHRLPPLVGDVVTADVAELRTTLVAALFGTVLAELVAAFGDPGLWRVAAGAVRGGVDGDAVLAGPLPVKATTAMRLAEDPLTPVWAYVDNPLAAA